MYKGFAGPNGAIKHGIARAIIVVSAVNCTASTKLALISVLMPKLMLRVQSRDRPCRHISADLIFCKAAGEHAMSG